MLKRILSQARDPLYKNSFFIMLSSITNAGFGFFFWMFAARLYPQQDVGIATALISLTVLITILSRFGFDFSVIRFFPIRDRNVVFSTSVIVSTAFAVLLGIIFVAGIDIFSPKLHLLKKPIYFLIFIEVLSINSIITLTTQTFIASRRGEYFLFQNIVTGSRIIFLFFLTSLGAMGIFGSVGIAFGLALFVASLILKREIQFKLTVSINYIKESFKFSAGNYLANLFSIAPNQVLPIMVLSMLGAEKAAHYYIAFAIASLIFMIPNSVAISLFVEGSYGESLKSNTVKSLIAIAGLLIPTVLFVYFFGDTVLILFGKGYLEALELLRIFVLSSFFVSIVHIYLAIKRVQMDVGGIIILNALTCSLLLLSSYLLMPVFGIVGVGYAWLLSYGFATLVVIGLIVVKEKWV